MIQVIAGRKGSGKTKRLIDLTNATAKEANHDVVFLDDNNRYMFDVDHKVRFINAEEYHVRNADMFIGFVCGMLSSNFDVGHVFVDAFLNLAHVRVEEAEPIIHMLNELGNKHQVTFVLSLSTDPSDVPGFMKEYLI